MSKEQDIKQRIAELEDQKKQLIETARVIDPDGIHASAFTQNIDEEIERLQSLLEDR
jgi:hypothetical protein